jgi:hypothetical protein
MSTVVELDRRELLLKVVEFSTVDQLRIVSYAIECCGSLS